MWGGEKVVNGKCDNGDEVGGRAHGLNREKGVGVICFSSGRHHTR